MSSLAAGSFGPYSAIGSDTTGPWEDLQGNVGEGDANRALTTEEFRDTPMKMRFFRHDQDDELHFSFQMPHCWAPDSDVRFHIHVIPCSDPASPQVVHWAGQYVWVGVGETAPANAGWTAFTVDNTVSPGDVFKQAVHCGVTIAPTAHALESDVLLFFVKRAGTDPADTYTTAKTGGTAAANLAVISADLHFERPKRGTDTQFTGSDF